MLLHVFINSYHLVIWMIVFAVSHFQKQFAFEQGKPVVDVFEMCKIHIAFCDCLLYASIYVLRHAYFYMCIWEYFPTSFHCGLVKIKVTIVSFYFKQFFNARIGISYNIWFNPFKYRYYVCIGFGHAWCLQHYVDWRVYQSSLPSCTSD